MPRIRSIKPEFWTSEVIASLSIPTRLTFIGLWNYVDDNGVGRDVPKLVVAALYPLEPDPAKALMRVHRTLTECSLRALISRYTVDSRPFFHVTGWTEHQKINRPGKARFPLPSSEFAMPVTCDDAAFDTSFSEDSLSPHGVLTEPSCPGAGRMEQGAGSREQGELSPSPVARATTVAAFDEFWIVYPRKVGRKAAQASFVRATRTVPAERLIAAARVYADDLTRDAAFTAHPATWLNQGRWDDEGPARPGSNVVAMTGRVAEGNAILLEAYNRGRSQQPELGA